MQGDPNAPAPQLFTPAGWKGAGQPPLYTAAQIAALSPTATQAAQPLSEDAKDAARYRAFFNDGLSVCFQGLDYYSKAECDAAIDGTQPTGGGQ